MSSYRPPDGGVSPEISDPKPFRSSPRGAAGITPERYDALLAFYREKPASFSGASHAVAGISVGLARKAWKEGWEPDYPAIQAVLEDEKAAARAARAAADSDAARRVRLAQVTAEQGRLDQIRADAVRTRTEEGQLVQFARAQSLLALNTAAQVLNGLGTLVPGVLKALADPSKPPSPAEFVILARNVALMGKQATESARIVLDLERVLMGEPTALGALAPPESREEAYAELEEAMAALTAAKAAPSVSPVRVQVAGLGPGKP